MPRRVLVLAVLSAAVVLGVWGCQDYNFNPVGSCVIQPGSQQVRLDDLSGADLLFVVDDSGSMDPKQQELATNFGVFIDQLSRFSVDRVARGQTPFDYHIAVTTSSIFRNYSWGTCQTTATQGEKCCVTQACTVGNSCSAGIESGTCTAASGSGTLCCLTPSVCDQGAAAHNAQCGRYATSYESPLSGGCLAGVATAGAPYPQGNFVALSSNPKVLHFQNLFTNCSTTPACTPGSACGTGKMCYGGTGATAVCCDDKTTAINTLTTQFQQNIQVGSCGSGEEQHLEAARLSIQKALAGQQPGVAAGEWPHANSKLVVVFVADEDDCSNPPNPATAIVLSGAPGSDTCVSNQNPLGNAVEYTVGTYVDFFRSLGRPFGGAFIVSATCSGGTCTPATCGSGGLAGYSPGVRLLGVASGIAAAGSTPVEGSVCDPFGATLVEIANLVTLPQKLTLDSVPATGDVTIVRIADSASGATRRICTQGLGWWFQDCSDPAPVPAVSPVPTRCIFIDHASGDCEANPGETYSAEYVGQLPPGGCTQATPTSAASTSCAQALPLADGGPSDPEDWWCYGPLNGTGTCVCRTP